ncbi:MAG: GNAT family N-acetyltransferase [Acidobacteria bacterium]|nr:GNAT family N-acetyltransferase [Acidobacteriota bacterium]
MPAHAEIRVETISGYQAFLELEPVWNEVAEASGLDHPFLTHAWVLSWWECFGAGSTLQILVLKAGEQTVAIAPLILTPIRMWGIKVRRLGFFYNSHVPRADFLIAQRPEEAYRAIWSHISRSRDWDLLQLCQLPEGSATLEAMPDLAAQDDCPAVTWLSGASPYLPLRGSWGQYFDSLAGKHRANLRNRLKRLNGIGPVEVETITSEEELTGSLEAALQLEAAAWKGDAGTAIASDPDVANFYSTLSRRAAERGWMRLNFLRAGPRRVAFDYSLSYKSRIHLLKLGYDPAYAPYSPSNLLLCMILQNTFGRDVSEYDFLGESAGWKLTWTGHSRPNYWLFIFSNTFKGRLLHLIKSRLVPVLKHKALQPLRNLVLRLAAHAHPGRN